MFAKVFGQDYCYLYTSWGIHIIIPKSRTCFMYDAQSALMTPPLHNRIMSRDENKGYLYVWICIIYRVVHCREHETK